MSFLNPILLFGSLGIAVPIVIHLLNKRRYEKVTWAAMRFLMNSIEQNQRRMKVEDLLLLLLRCALLVLLALALARPAIPGGGAGGLFGGAGVTAALVLDNSYSMGLSDGVATRFENAKLALNAAIDAMPTNSRAAVLLASDAVDAAILEPTLDLNLARKTIREARLTDRASDVVPAIRASLEVVRKRADAGGGRREVYFATDGQAAGWRQFENATAALSEASADVATHVLLVGPRAEANVGVSGLRLASGLPVVDRPMRFEARITNHGRAEARNVRVRLLVNDGAPADQATIDVLPPGEHKSVSLFAKVREAGGATVTAALDADRLPADDRRTVAVRATGQLNVLLVNGTAGAAARDADAFFLQRALAPLGQQAAGEHFIKATAADAVDLSGVRFEEFDAVVLANVPDLPPPVAESLVSYVRGGGGLVVFPGPGVESTANLFYNEQLYRKTQLLPAMLGPAAGDARPENAGQPLQSQNFEHPIAALWNDPAAGSLADVHVRRAFPLTAGPEDATDATRQPGSGAPQVVLRLADGSPVMMERTFGAGRVVLFGTTANTAWTDLPVRPGAYVPLLYRTLASLVARQDDALNLPVGGAFRYRAPLEWLTREVVVTPPGGRPEGGPQQTAKVELAGDVPVLNLDATTLGGGYALRVATDPPATLRFAAQPDPAESNLAEITPEQEKALAAAATVIRWTPGTPLEQVVQQARVGTELWLPIAIVALLIAASETFLAQWFSRPK